MMEPLSNKCCSTSSETSQDNQPQPHAAQVGEHTETKSTGNEERHIDHQEGAPAADAQLYLGHSCFVQTGQTLQQPVPTTQSTATTQCQWPQPQYSNGVYTAAMQLERAGRGNLQYMSQFGGSDVASVAAAQAQLHYPTQLQYCDAGSLPIAGQPQYPQYSAQQQVYLQQLFQLQNLQQLYRQEIAQFNPYQPTSTLYATRDINPPYQQSLDADTSNKNFIHHNPQHSSLNGGSSENPSLHIREINNNDVLCGRGGVTNVHLGNKAFRLMVKEFQSKYVHAKKKEKIDVAGKIVEKVRNLDPPGRFLKKCVPTGYWLDIGDMQAKEKTMQALREGAPRIRRQLKEEASLVEGEGVATESVNT